ncbi:MAG: glycosyltransferase family 2 protein, partial [Specibacter sp.]
FPMAVIAILGATLFLGRRGRTMWWSLVPSVAVYLPFAVSAWGNPRALLVDPGVPLASLPGQSWLQLLGFPQAVNASKGLLGLGSLTDAPVWTWIAVLVIGVPVVLVALAALVLPLRRAGTARTLWLVAVLALAVSYASKLIAVALDGNVLATPFNGPAVSVAFFALLGAALLGYDAVYRRAYDPAQGGAGEHRGAKATAVVLSVLLVAAPVASLGIWSANNLSGKEASLTGASMVRSATFGSIPATAADRGTGPEASRTIVLRVEKDAGVAATLMQGDGTTLDALSGIAAAQGITGKPGQEKVAAPDSATAMLRETVAAMMAQSGIDPRPELMKLGVGFVVLQNGDTAAELLAAELEAVPGLDAVGPTDSGWLFRVKPTYKSAGATDVVNRVALVDATGAAIAPLASDGLGVSTQVPKGTQGRRVVMAERFDPGWSAWFNGKEVKAVQDEWAQSFELPAAAGKLEIRYEQPWNMLLSLAQLVLLGLTVLLAVPVRARRGRTGAYRDEASLQRVGRGV